MEPKVMKVSFIGYSSALVSIATFFRNKKFDVLGLYDKDYMKLIDIGIKHNFKVKLDLEKMIYESDIIFICDKEENLKNISYELSKYDLSEKIMCVVSKYHTSDEFDMFDTAVTFLPIKDFIEGETTDIENAKTIVEGCGKRADFFMQELKFMKINFEEVDKNKKMAYLFSLEYSTEFLDAFISSIKDFLENAKIYDKSYLEGLIFDNVKNYYKSPKDISYFEKPILTKNEDQISSHFEIIEKYGDSNLKALYKVIAFNLIEHTDYSKSEKDRIRRIIYNK